jgi:hypothetical protein
VQQVGFQGFKSDLELILLLNEAFLLGGKVRTLLSDDQSQKLVLKTNLSDSKVDQCALSLDFWWVMGIAQLGVEVKLEVVVERKLFISKLDVLVLALLYDGASVHRLNNSVNTVFKVLNEHGLTLLKGNLNGSHHLVIRQTGDLEIGVLLLFSDPGNALELWVNDQGVTIRVCKNGGVLSGNSVGWQFLRVPNSLLGIVGQDKEGVGVRG